MKRSWYDMQRLVRRAEARWHRRHIQHGSWAAMPVLEAMYLAKALHVVWREAYA